MTNLTFKVGNYIVTFDLSAVCDNFSDGQYSLWDVYLVLADKIVSTRFSLGIHDKPMHVDAVQLLQQYTEE